MDIVNKDIKVAIRKDTAGIIVPNKIYIINDDYNSQTEYKVKRVIRRDNELIDGQMTTMYTCLIELENFTRICDVRFYHDTKKWLLYRF